ncbi:ABC transporter permease subunit [Priestia koreensis]|uniref:ABC transporter permease subunit n=1 Tax=Priestia koreensis TaxID=284581 RepID=UPI001F573442|nr:ABC transporter permease subunit [Priestia koreensis]UNL86797.1 ABC transporter permease subunit [Priestia koreensis]
MNFHLLKANIKSQSKNLSTYALGSLMYLWILIWVFPSIVSTKGINELINSLPDNFLQATGLEGGITELNSYLAGEYYGLIFLLLLTIFSIVVSTQLVAQLVDRGAMAYLLTTPSSRVRVVTTQAVTLIIGLVTVVLFNYVGGIVGASLFLEKHQINTSVFLKINIMGGMLFLLVCAYSFFFSCVLNDEKYAMGASAGLTLFFYGLDMFGKLSEDLEWLRNISIFGLFRPQEIVAGKYEIGTSSILLLLASLVTFILSIVLFKKRDLPL